MKADCSVLKHSRNLPEHLQSVLSHYLLIPGVRQMSIDALMHTQRALPVPHPEPAWHPPGFYPSKAYHEYQFLSISADAAPAIPCNPVKTIPLTTRKRQISASLKRQLSLISFGQHPVFRTGH